MMLADDDAGDDEAGGDDGGPVDEVRLCSECNGLADADSGVSGGVWLRWWWCWCAAGDCDGLLLWWMNVVGTVWTRLLLPLPLLLLCFCCGRWGGCWALMTDGRRNALRMALFG